MYVQVVAGTISIVVAGTISIVVSFNPGTNLYYYISHRVAS